MLLPATPGWVSLPVVVCGSPPLLAGVCWRRWCVVCGVWCVVCGVRRWCVGGVVAGVWCGWSLATPGGGPCVLLPSTPGLFRCRWWWAFLPTPRGGSRARFPATPGWGPLAAVVCGGVVAGVWCGWSLTTPGGGSCVLLPATPGWVSLPVVVCGSPPLLAGVCWRLWCVVCGVWCVVCGVRRWCVGGVVAGVWCGWSLATPGGGSCVLLPATPGWVSLPVVVGSPRHSWLRAPGAVPRHSWLGSAGGGVMWSGCGWCVVWLVPRHSWRRFLCATPRHSWLGFATGGGVRLPATPGWGPPVVVVCFAGWGVLCCVRLWCVWVCAVAVLYCVSRVRGVCVVGGVVWWCGWCVLRVCWCVWLRVCGVLVVCGLVSPPLASPDRWPWAWFPATPGWGPLVVVVGALGALLLGLVVCVCAVWPFVLVWVAWWGDRARSGCRACACVCLWLCLWLVGCVIPWLVLVVGRRHGSKSRRRGPVDA